MTYWLGIDLGTTYTAAALCRSPEGRSARGTADNGSAAGGEVVAEVVPLGARQPAVPSVLFLAEDGSLLVGEAAQRRALTDPDRVVREFKPRIGDDTPLLVGGNRHLADELAAKLVHWTWQQVVAREGGWPERVALTCPASWGPYKWGLLTQAVRAVGIPDVELLSEPQAAAISYASRERVEVGAKLAVYDLGGGTFDAAVVRKDSPSTFIVLGDPEGVDGLGGVTFDEAIFDHVCAAAGMPVLQLDPEDPDVVAEVARLRRECTEAKEALSADTATTVPVVLGGVRERVRVTRGEFEEMIRSDLERTVDTLRRALESAGVDAAGLDAILLIGGSSRIPLVSQLISEQFGTAPAIDTDPKTAVAAGAARFLVPAAVLAPEVRAQPAVPDLPPERPPVAALLADDAAAIPSQPRHRTRKAVVGTSAVLLLLVAGGVTALRTPQLSKMLGTSTGSQGTKYNAIDPWTGQPWTKTTAAGPTRPANLLGATPGRFATPSGSTRTGGNGTAPASGSSRTATPGTSRAGSTKHGSAKHNGTHHPGATPTDTPTPRGTPTPTGTSTSTGTPTPTVKPPQHPPITPTTGTSPPAKSTFPSPNPSSNNPAPTPAKSTAVVRPIGRGAVLATPSIASGLV